MSYYYHYYVGYMTEDGMVYPLGPYDCFGQLHSAVWRSRSFASDLHEDFYGLDKKAYSDKLKQEFSYKDWEGTERLQDVRYLPLTELGSGDFIKRGYFLIEDVGAFEDAGRSFWDFDGFYDRLSPEVYAAKAANETRFGKPEKKYDAEGEEITPHSAAEYMYYAYPDYNCREYEVAQLKSVANAVSEFADTPKGATIVILETEG